MQRVRFGDLLRRLRTEAGKTMSEVATHLDVSVPYLSEVERCRKAPLTADRIRVVAAFLGVPPEDLIAAGNQDRHKLELQQPASAKGVEVGFQLQRAWPDFREDDFEKLKTLISEAQSRRKGGS